MKIKYHHNENLYMTELDSTVPEIDITDYNETIANIFPQKACVVAWMYDRVFIRMIENGDILFDTNKQPANCVDPDYLRQMRIFTKDKELYLYRSGGKIKHRLREDNFNGAGTQAVIASQVLFGTRAKKKDSETIITEVRGTRLTVPFPNINVDDNQQRLMLQTVNYVDFHEETCQASYVDCRFLGFAHSFGKVYC
jgi:CRISPR-associated protein (TIGR03984 family)